MKLQIEYNYKIDKYANELGKGLDFSEFCFLIQDMYEFFSGTESWFERINREKIIFELEEIKNRLENEGYVESEFIDVKARLKIILLQSKSIKKIY